MSELRQDFIDAMSDRWGGDAESVAEYTAAADDFLRVLAGIGDTEQVREEVAAALWTAFREDSGFTEAVMAVVAPRLAAARQQLDQVRELADENADVGIVRVKDLYTVLDAPARPADTGEETR